MGGTNVWDAEWEVNEEQARTLIGRQFSQLSSKQVKRLGWGWDNTVFSSVTSTCSGFQEERLQWARFVWKGSCCRSWRPI